MEKYTYQPQGTCSKLIEIEIEGQTVHHVRFQGGCNGNLQGISRLIEGMPKEEVIRRLKGIRCGTKLTSCPDQLAKALEETK